METVLVLFKTEPILFLVDFPYSQVPLSNCIFLKLAAYFTDSVRSKADNT